MLTRRIITIAALILSGFIVLTIGVWALAFNAKYSTMPASDANWWLGRLPVAIGGVLIVAGFLLLGRTRVARPLDEIDYEDPTG